MLIKSNQIIAHNWASEIIQHCFWTIQDLREMSIVEDCLYRYMDNYH
jgi:hypothetical protein